MINSGKKKPSQLPARQVQIESTPVPKGEIRILRERCKGCSYCVQFCPKKVLEISKEHNHKGYYFPIVKNPQECIGCKLCSLFCPDFAIYFKKGPKASS